MFIPKLERDSVFWHPRPLQARQNAAALAEIASVVLEPATSAGYFGQAPEQMHAKYACCFISWTW